MASFFFSWIPMKRHLPKLLFLASLALAFLVYFPGATGYFLFDDNHNIVENSNIRIRALSFQELKHAALSGQAGMLGRPLSVVSFALNYYFNGLSPFAFKLTNIVIHLLNSICVFILTSLILDAHRQLNQQELSQNHTRWISLAVAAAWLLHPFNLTSVLYIVQRMTSLAALFTLLGLISYVYGRRRIAKDRFGWGWILAGFVLFTPLAAYSKENGALLPVFMLLTELVFFRFRAPSISGKYLLMTAYGFTVALPFVGLLIYTAYNPGWFMGGYAFRDFSLSERLMTESRVIWLYIRMIFVPDITWMGMYHDDIVLSKSMLQPISTIFASIGIFALGIVAILANKRQPVVTFGILFFLIGHSIESSIIALELVHEHRNYLPSYGLLLILFYYLLYPLRHQQSLSLRNGVGALFILVLAGITFQRATQWGDPVLMKIKEADHHPDSIRANISLAAFYASMPASSQAEAEDFYQRAYAHYAKAAELSKTDTLGLFGLIDLNSKYALPIEASWITALAGRIEKHPFAASTGNSIANLENCVVNGDCKQSPELVANLIQAALRNPTLQGNAKTQILFAWSDFLFKVNNLPDAAAAEAYRAIDANPQNLENQIILINMLISMGKLTEAQAQIAQTRKLDKMDAHTHALNQLEKHIASM